MAPDVTSVSLVICEKIETDEKGLFSAIRVADVYRLNGDPDPVVVHALLIIKTEPTADPNTEHALDVILFNPEGLPSRLTPENEVVRFFSSMPEPGIYGGITVTIAMNLGVSLGNYMLRVWLDREEVCKAPIMLLPALGQSSD